MTFMAGVPISVRIEKPLMSSSSLKSIPEAICRQALMGIFSSSVPLNSGIYFPIGSSILPTQPSDTAIPISADTKDLPMELEENSVFLCKLKYVTSLADFLCGLYLRGMLERVRQIFIFETVQGNVDCFYLSSKTDEDHACQNSDRADCDSDPFLFLHVIFSFSM